MSNQDNTYNGWTNYETWNVALWLANDEGLYAIVTDHSGDYESLADEFRMIGIEATPDGVSYHDEKLGHKELDSMLEELR